MRRLLWIALALAVLGAGAFYVTTAPRTLQATALPDHAPDPENGERIFHAGGCASCHAAPASDRCDDPGIADESRLAGGRCLVTPFGTFHVPNISPHDETGIGGWRDVDFVNAVMRGVSPGGAHYYPAFPYTSYQRMRIEDVLDLKAYLGTLPAVNAQVSDHDLPAPFRLRRGLGLWKLLFLDGAPFAPDPDRSDAADRGAYLVEAVAHCGECHTPRDWLGGTIGAEHLSGGPAPEGDGHIPNITPHENGIGDWSEADIGYAFETGLTPEFDSMGGAMALVQENLSKLPEEDRAAIAAYLKTVPPLPGRERDR